MHLNFRMDKRPLCPNRLALKSMRQFWDPFNDLMENAILNGRRAFVGQKAKGFVPQKNQLTQVSLDPCPSSETLALQMYGPNVGSKCTIQMCGPNVRSECAGPMCGTNVRSECAGPMCGTNMRSQYVVLRIRQGFT